MITIGNLNLNIDFEYRIIREEDNDMDLFIDLNYRSLDIDTQGADLFTSRIQFPFVRSIILRLNKENIGITYTSGEGLTAFGQGKGMQCFCVVTIK